MILILLFTIIHYNLPLSECQKTDRAEKKIVTSIQESSLNYLFNNLKNNGHCEDCCECCNHLIYKYSYSCFNKYKFNLKLLKLNSPNSLFIDSIYHPPELV